MSLFGPETNRLIRVRWVPEQLNDFAQEVYALLSGKLPMTIDAPVKIRPTDGSTPLTVTQPTANTDTPAVVINNGGTEQTIGGITNGDVTFGGITFNPPASGVATPPVGGGSPGGGDAGGGGIDLGGLDLPSGPPDPAAVPVPGQNPFVLYGEVVSKVAGSQYAVNVWAKDPDSAPRLATLAVEFKGVDPADAIPAGTPCPVLCFPGPTTANALGIVQAIGFVASFFPAA